MVDDDLVDCEAEQDDRVHAPLLQRRATLGDVIAWSLVVPMLLVLPVCSAIPLIIPIYATMFLSLHARLPLATQLVLGLPGPVWILLPMATVAAVVAILLATRDDIAKVVCATVGFLIVAGVIVLAVLGILRPILELQKQLS